MVFYMGAWAEAALRSLRTYARLHNYCVGATHYEYSLTDAEAHICTFIPAIQHFLFRLVPVGDCEVVVLRASKRPTEE